MTESYFIKFLLIEKFIEPLFLLVIICKMSNISYCATFNDDSIHLLSLRYHVQACKK